jgi:hypothetical protein
VTGALKPGEYPAQIIRVKVKFSKCGNFEQHALRVRVDDTANDHWEDLWERLTLSDTAIWKVEQAMSAVGLVEKEGKLQIKRWLPEQRVKPTLVRKFPEALERLQGAPVAAGDGLLCRSLDDRALASGRRSPRRYAPVMLLL